MFGTTADDHFRCQQKSVGEEEPCSPFPQWPGPAAESDDTAEAWLRWEGGCALPFSSRPWPLGLAPQKGKAVPPWSPVAQFYPPDTLVSEIRHVVQCHLWLSRQRFSLWVSGVTQGAEPSQVEVSLPC